MYISSRFLKLIYNEFVVSDIPFNKFKELCSIAWNDNTTIDMKKKSNEGKYRNKIDHYFIVE